MLVAALYVAGGKECLCFRSVPQPSPSPSTSFIYLEREESYCLYVEDEFRDQTYRDFCSPLIRFVFILLGSQSNHFRTPCAIESGALC